MEDRNTRNKQQETNISRTTTTHAILAIAIFVMGSLQAWDSDVPKAGLLIVLLVSLAITLPPVALLVPLKSGPHGNDGLDLFRNATAA